MQTIVEVDRRPDAAHQKDVALVYSVLMENIVGKRLILFDAWRKDADFDPMTCRRLLMFDSGD